MTSIGGTPQICWYAQTTKSCGFFPFPQWSACLVQPWSCHYHTASLKHTPLCASQVSTSRFTFNSFATLIETCTCPREYMWLTDSFYISACASSATMLAKWRQQIGNCINQLWQQANLPVRYVHFAMSNNLGDAIALILPTTAINLGLKLIRSTSWR